MNHLFDSPGKENTDETVRLAHERAVELGISEVVVATTTGSTAGRVLDVFEGFSVIAVTYHCGFRKPFETLIPQDARAVLEARGAKVVQATHALSGVERSFAKKFSGVYPVLVMAEVLRLFGQGVKVAVEVAIMAADAGVLSGGDVVSIGGSARGADAALILKPASQSDVFDIKIREVICKPRNF